MQTKINYTTVGGFFLGLLLIGIILILWLSSGISWERYQTYLIYMKEAVSGLNIDSAVEYNGVTVGSVKRIELNEKDPHIVEVYLSLKENTPVTEGTLATVTTRGLTGLAFIALQDKGDHLKKLLAKPGEDYPVIQTAPSLFVRLDTLLSRLTENVDTLSRSLQTLLSPYNQKAFQHILNHLDQVTLSLSKQDEQFERIMKNTQTISAELIPMIQNLNGTLNIFQQQTLPSLYQATNNTSEFSMKANELTHQFEQNPASILRGERNMILGPGEKP